MTTRLFWTAEMDKVLLEVMKKHQIPRSNPAIATSYRWEAIVADIDAQLLRDKGVTAEKAKNHFKTLQERKIKAKAEEEEKGFSCHCFPLALTFINRRREK
jgi:hypothetical protein